MLATVTAGTPQNLAQLLIGYNPAAGAMSTPPIPSYQPVYATRVFIQMASGGSGKGIIFDGVPLGVTPTDTSYGDIVAELAPATATAPGGSYSDATPGHLVGAPQIDLRRMWIDGSNNGDGIRVSAYLVD